MLKQSDNNPLIINVRLPLNDGRDLVETKISVQFPLSDGRDLVQGPLTYNQDGLATRHNADFIFDPKFTDAYQAGTQNGNPETHVEWRVHVALWCASHAIKLQGDFVECGVHTGILSGAIAQWLDFAAHPSKRFYLFDTWNGIPEEQISPAERLRGVARMNRKYQDGDEVYATVARKFSKYNNIIITRGMVPDTLGVIGSDRSVAFISIDMNVVQAEMEAIGLLWPCLLEGGIVLIDDYGWSAHIEQKKAWDAFAELVGHTILQLPTGQGIILKR